ncbi:hypothetical protein GN244_ATG12263 [Phytophthora infestans]|uniref:Uncharacterized protein n=1 Tax=Phytophthora infestans TaxID=4787 RepID=A0A833RYX3_PHYIN|nr:hypothetical protein GN244_ATG12263 [Phytophthora infestans]KAF4137123.1 hypothetical protein GN958_ATG13707 [Phytophthora infestans]
MTSRKSVDSAAVGEQMSFLYEPDKLTQQASLVLEDVNVEGLMEEMETLLSQSQFFNVPT